MQNSNKQSVSGQELDNLLQQAFLNLDVTNPKYTHLMETVANHTLTTLVPVAGKASSSYFSLKWILAFVGILSGIAIGSFFIITHEDKEADVIKTIAAPTPLVPGKEVETTEQSNAALPGEYKSGDPEKNENGISGTHPVAGPGPFPPKEKLLPAIIAEAKVPSKDTGYVFPVLSDEEIKANEKRKEKMLMQAIKLASAKYAFIPQTYLRSEYFSSKGPFNARYMQTTEVSNIEYKTFLFDLLMRNNRAGFLKARPKQTLWNTIYDQKIGKYFEDMYFSDKAYDHYPVVNVSREGAELYCKWLKEESQYLAEEKDILKEEERDKLYDRRYSLPTAKEWAYAAEAGKIGNDYPWDGKFMRNSRGAYLANFCIEKETPGTSSSGHYTSAEVGLGAGQVALMCRVDGFKANGFGLYNMSGNAAELVLDDSTKHLLAKGGSWNSGADALKIGSSENVEGNGASPYHGFRPVINVKLVKTAFSYLDSDSTSSYKDTATVFSGFKYKSFVVTPVITHPLNGSKTGGDTIFLFRNSPKKKLKRAVP